MPRINRLLRRREPKALTAAEELELILGLNGASVFPSEEARRQAYYEHRDELLKDAGRTWAWVTYEGGGFLGAEGGRVSRALNGISADMSASC